MGVQRNSSSVIVWYGQPGIDSDCPHAFTVLGVLIEANRATLRDALAVAGLIIEVVAFIAGNRPSACASTCRVVEPVHISGANAGRGCTLTSACFPVVEGDTKVGTIVAIAGILGKRVDKGSRGGVVVVVDIDYQGIASALQPRSRDVHRMSGRPRGAPNQLPV